MLGSRIEVTGSRAMRDLVRGNSARIEAVMDMTHPIAVHEMHQALEEIGSIAEANLVRVSPVGKGNPGTLDHGGTTPPRSAGTLKASWSHSVRRVAGDLVLEVASDDPVSKYVDGGTGLHRTGGRRRSIRADDKPFPVPAGQLSIGGSRGKGKKTLDVRFLRKTSGNRAQHIVERAQAATRPTVGPIIRAAAARAKRDIKAALKGA